MDDVTRRRAVKLTAAGAAAALVAGSVRAKDDEKKDESCFKGSSRKGNIQDALDDAIKNAHAAAPGADRQVRYKVKGVSGVNGGIDPLNNLTVEIEVTFA